MIVIRKITIIKFKLMIVKFNLIFMKPDLIIVIREITTIKFNLIFMKFNFMIVKSKITGKPIIAIECDGAKYHSSNEAYAWDMFRQSRLEEQGFIFYRIWSTNWWYSSEKELKKHRDSMAPCLERVLEVFLKELCVLCGYLCNY